MFYKLTDQCFQTCRGHTLQERPPKTGKIGETHIADSGELTANGMWGWNLEQKQDISGETGKI